MNILKSSLYSVYIHIKHINFYSSRLALKFFEDPYFLSIFSQNFQIPPFFRVKMFRDPLLEKICLNHHYLVDKMHIKHFLYFDTCIEIFQWSFSKTPLFGVEILKTPPQLLQGGYLNNGYSLREWSQFKWRGGGA